MDRKWVRNLKDWPAIEPEFTVWEKYMWDHVDFALTTSVIHTKEHAERVLLFALLMAHKLGLDKKDREALCHAAIFHDTRRHDDSYDVGHGGRAAVHYKEFCQEHHLDYDPRTALVMAYHDHSDAEGIAQAKKSGLKNAVLLYQIFKDADGLDRYRLAPHGLDVKYLRTTVSPSLVPLAKRMNGRV